MSFQQITININSKQADKLSDIFLSLNVLSVSIEDQYAHTPLEQPIFDEPGMQAQDLWEHSKVVVLINQATQVSHLMQQAMLFLGCSFTYTVEVINDQDWVSLSQSQFTPIHVNDKLCIVPSWHKASINDAMTIILDPGLSFGTGSHPTTFMCLEWITKHVSPKYSVLDYGCGSGILAIAAKKFGAQLVYGTDIDEQAISSSKHNAQQNQVNIKFSLPHQLPLQQFDIVIANILSNPLRLLAPMLANLTCRHLILSGILASQSIELTEIYRSWFKVQEYQSMDGWVLLECSKF